MSVIETAGLTKKYGGFLALDRLTINVEEGEVLGLLGPNGAGKTTTLLMLTTLLKPTAGTARVNGFDIIKDPGNVRKSIGIVFQDPSSDDILTGYENLKLHGMLYSMQPALREKRIGEVLDLVELSDRKDSRVRQYSGGMRRRLELARGLMHHPKILFLDEPTLGLDPQSREHIWRYIENLARHEKVTVIITSHYMEEVDRLCSRLAIIDEGKVVALDTPANLKRVIGGDVVSLRMRGQGAGMFGKLDFVRKVESKGDMVYLTVVNASECLPQILRAAGLDAVSVEVHSPTLNDVFLHYTGKEIREAAGEGGWAERSMHYTGNR